MLFVEANVDTVVGTIDVVDDDDVDCDLIVTIWTFFDAIPNK